MIESLRTPAGRTQLTTLAIYALLALPALTVLVPLYLVVATSLKNVTEAATANLALPNALHLDNYTEVLIQGQIGRAFLNGLFISGSSIVLIVALSSTAAFVLTRRETRARKWLRLALAVGLIAPLQIIPEIKVLQLLHLMGSYPGVILIHAASWLPFGILLYSGFIKGIPRELDEAATLDGCRPVQLFFRIIFPLLKPVTSTLVVIVFTGIWNDFQTSLYFLGKQSMYTMPLTLFAFTGFHTADMNLISADIVLTLLPVVLVFLFAQRYIIAGLTAGALRG